MTRDGRGDQPRRRLVLAARPVFEDDGGSRRAREQAVEEPLETRGAPAVVAHAADHRARELGRGVEAPQHRLEVHAPHHPQRLHVQRRVRAREPRVAPAQRPVHFGLGGAQLAREQRRVPARIAELVGRDPDVIGLLRQRQRGPVPVEQRAAPRLEDDTLGALGRRLGGVAAALHQLHLSGARHQHPERREQADLHHAESNDGLRHGQRGGGEGGGDGRNGVVRGGDTGTGSRMISVSAGSRRPSRWARGNSTARLWAVRMRRSRAARRP